MRASDEPVAGAENGRNHLAVPVDRRLTKRRSPAPARSPGTPTCPLPAGWWLCDADVTENVGEKNEDQKVPLS